MLFTGKQNYYKSGDTIELFIVLRDGNRVQRSEGGDELRIRSFNNDKQAYAAGRVKDHKNGTYTASVQAYWPGKHFIEVMLVNTRESIRALFYINQQVI